MNTCSVPATKWQFGFGLRSGIISSSGVLKETLYREPLVAVSLSMLIFSCLSNSLEVTFFLLLLCQFEWFFLGGQRKEETVSRTLVTSEFLHTNFLVFVNSLQHKTFALVKSVQAVSFFYL